MAPLQSVRCHLQLLNELRKCLRPSNLIQTSSYSISASSNLGNEKAEFKWPDRIERSPTDILKAIESTIKRDKTGPHYRYHDDPFLTPQSNVEKRTFSMAKENGRKAAMMIRDQNPELFFNMSDNPLIKSFLPTTEYSENSTVTADTLRELVATYKVPETVTVYKLCVEQGIELDAETLQSLLELLCFSNEEELLSDEFYEEHNLSRMQHPGTETQNTWKMNGLADTLFDQLSNPSAAAYAAIIRGLAKYNHVDDAWKRYSEAISNDISLDLETYNSLIVTIVPKTDDYEIRWTTIMELLEAMARHNLKPDTKTLNNCMQVMSRSAFFRKSKDYSLRLLKEMSLQGVKPSLATYYFLLNIHCRDKGPVSMMLYSILDELEEEEGDFELRDYRDSFFFSSAMLVCKRHLQDLEPAHRLNDLLEKGQNRKFIGENFKEVVYYRTYLSLAVSTLPLQEFMVMYNDLIPHIYSPEPDLMEEIVRVVGVHGSFQYIPTLWTDINAVQVDNTQVVSALLNTMVQYVPQESDVVFQYKESATAKPQTAKASQPRVLGNEFTRRTASLQEQMVKIIDNLVSNLEFYSLAERKSGKMIWTAVHASQMLQVLATCGGCATGVRLLVLLEKNPELCVGELYPENAENFFECSIRENNFEAAFKIASYYGNHFGRKEAVKMAQQIVAEFKMDAFRRSQLAIEFGADIVRESADRDAKIREERLQKQKEEEDKKKTTEEEKAGDYSNK